MLLIKQRDKYMYILFSMTAYEDSRALTAADDTDADEGEIGICRNTCSTKELVWFIGSTKLDWFEVEIFFKYLSRAQLHTYKTRKTHSTLRATLQWRQANEKDILSNSNAGNFNF